MEMRNSYLSLQEIEDLVPSKVLKIQFPHVWQRITLFNVEPLHMKNYINEIIIQRRGDNREGFPEAAIKELHAILMANERFCPQVPLSGWSSLERTSDFYKLRRKE